MRIAVERGRGDEAGAAARDLRRARRRSGVDRVLPRARARLRLLLALPRAGRPARGRAGGAGRAGRRRVRPGRRLSGMSAHRARPAPPRREHVERPGPLHRLGRRRPEREGRGGGGARRRAARASTACCRTSCTPRCCARAIRTTELALEAAGRSWIPVRRSWRLNERHYGALQGKSKAETRLEFGDEQFMLWRRSYDVPPPPLPPESELAAWRDPRYAALPPDVLPQSECLKDVLARMLPYWCDAIVPDLRAGADVLVSAHGNSLRALVKHLDGIADDEIAELNVPTGVPLVYELDDRLRPAARGRPRLRRQRDVPRSRRGGGVDRRRPRPGRRVRGSGLSRRSAANPQPGRAFFPMAGARTRREAEHMIQVRIHGRGRTGRRHRRRAALGRRVRRGQVRPGVPDLRLRAHRRARSSRSAASTTGRSGCASRSPSPTR